MGEITKNLGANFFNFRLQNIAKEMSDAVVEAQETVQWTVQEVAGEVVSGGDGQVEPVYVAMQPDDGDGQLETVEVQEVVIVTDEVGEQVTEIVENAVQVFDQKSNILSVGGEEVIQGPYVQVPYTVTKEEYQDEDEKPVYSQTSKHSPGRSSRGRLPGRPPKTHFSYRPKPKLEPPSDDDDFPAPASMSTPQYPRSRGGKSLSRIPKVEPPVGSSSDSDSESDSEVRFGRLLREYQPKKKPKPREFAHRYVLLSKQSVNITCTFVT